MKKKGIKIKLFLAILGICMVGVIIAQFYWIMNAYSLKEVNFNSQTKMAIEQVTAQLEDRLTVIETFNKIRLNPNDNLVLLRNYSDSSKQGTDTVRQFIKNYYFGDSLLSYRTLPATTMHSTAEIFIKYHYLPDSIVNETWINDHNDISRIQLNEAKEIFSGRFQLSKVFGTEHISSYLDSILNESFERAGISSPFYFTVESLPEDSAIIIKGPHNDLSEFDNVYKASFFQESYFYAPHELNIYFPVRKEYLLGSMWLFLTGSILVILASVISFYFVAKKVLQQKKLTEMKNDFINNMTHEFKTPIANIFLALDMLNSNAEPGSGFTNFLNIIGNENKRLNDNVEKILQISRMDKHELKFQIQELDIHRIIREAVESFQLQLNKKEGKIDTVFTAKNVLVHGDELHLKNIFHNLIDNGLKYNEGKPVISIKTRDTQKGIEIMVADNGIGIRSEDQKRIFEKFYRVSMGDQHDYKGFGLGLSYVLHIVKVHHGDIKVSSNPGNGSVFKVKLPATEQKVKRYARSSESIIS